MWFFKSVLLMLLTLASLVSAPLQAQDASGEPVTVEAFRPTNIRSGPNTSYEVIAQLAEGEVVPVVGRSDIHSNWLRINADGRTGWVAYFTVTVNGDPTTVPILQQEEAQGISAPITPTATEVPDTAQSSLYVTAYRRVNIRSGPGTEFSIIGVLVPGETADIIGSSGERAEWLQIDFNGSPGWVAFFVVNVSGDLTALAPQNDVARTLSLPAAFLAEQTSSIARNQVVVITRFNTNLREEPRFGSSVVAVIPYETTLEVDARTPNSDWLRVSYEGTEGWLITSLVNRGVSDVTSLPVVDPAPPPAES